MDYELTKHAKLRVAQRHIRATWIEQTLARPKRTEPDRDDPELRLAYRPIAAAGNRVLCVVYNFTASPWRVVTVFFEE